MDVHSRDLSRLKHFLLGDTFPPRSTVSQEYFIDILFPFMVQTVLQLLVAVLRFTTLSVSILNPPPPQTQ